MSERNSESGGEQTPHLKRALYVGLGAVLLVGGGVGAWSKTHPSDPSISGAGEQGFTITDIHGPLDLSVSCHTDLVGSTAVYPECEVELFEPNQNGYISTIASNALDATSSNLRPGTSVTGEVTIIDGSSHLSPNQTQWVVSTNIGSIQKN